MYIATKVYVNIYDSLLNQLKAPAVCGCLNRYYIDHSQKAEKTCCAFHSGHSPVLP